MQRVIYADVLVVVNIYITYFLLKSTSILAKNNPDRFRLFIASFLGGIYSLSVLLPENLQMLFSVLRLGASVIFVLLAFGYTSPKSFLRLNLCFLLSSFLFAGLMLALWYFICPRGMYFNGSVVYFDIDIMTLAVLTVVCYAFLRLFDRFFKSRAPVNTVFLCDVFYENECFRLKAFLDTGNRLTDYFTGKPVIVAQSGIFRDKLSADIKDAEAMAEKKIRLIFCDTLGGKGVLPAFSPESVHIKGADFDFTTSEAVVALTDKKLLQGEYDAILPMGLFENIIERKDETENEKLTVTSETDKGADI